MRIIDAHRVENLLQMCGSYHGVIAYDTVITILHDVPTIDAPQWIPVTERLPEDLQEVNITYVNTNPEPYYDFIKGQPMTGTAVFYKNKWYWYSEICADLLAEYDFNPGHEIDDAINVTAWMPLPEPYKEV